MFQHNLIIIFLNLISSNRLFPQTSVISFEINSTLKFVSLSQYLHHSYSHNWHKRDKNKSISPWLAKQASIHSACPRIQPLLSPAGQKGGKIATQIPPPVYSASAFQRLDLRCRELVFPPTIAHFLFSSRVKLKALLLKFIPSFNVASVK